MSNLVTLTLNTYGGWFDGKRNHVIGTGNPTGSYAAGGIPCDFTQVAVSQQIPIWADFPAYRGYFFEYIPGTSASDGKLKIYSGGSGDTAATGTLTSDNTNVANNDTVTIGASVYTFKTVLTNSGATPGEVLIGGSADASLLNLIHAINGTGTPGTDYGTGTPMNASVTAASSVTSHTFAVTAINKGDQGNAIATTETSAHLSWGATTLTGGADPSPSWAELGAGAMPSDLTSYQIPFYAIFPQLF